MGKDIKVESASIVGHQGDGIPGIGRADAPYVRDEPSKAPFLSHCFEMLTALVVHKMADLLLDAIDCSGPRVDLSLGEDMEQEVVVSLADSPDGDDLGPPLREARGVQVDVDEDR